MNVEAVKESNRYQNLDIELMNADPSYYYTPYVSYYEDDMTLCADSYIYGNQESSYSVAYDPLFIVNYIPIGSKIEVEGIKDSDLKRLYNDYVNKTYLQVPRFDSQKISHEENLLTVETGLIHHRSPRLLHTGI